MKAVFDTNVLIAAFVTDGLCTRILRRARRREFEFILVTPVQREFLRILKEKLAFSEAEISLFSTILAEAATFYRQELAGSPVAICRDPDDDVILACAVESGANYLVTGDKDLLVIGQYEKTRILAPREFETLFSD